MSLQPVARLTEGRNVIVYEGTGHIIALTHIGSYSMGNNEWDVEIANKSLGMFCEFHHVGSLHDSSAIAALLRAYCVEEAA